MATKKPSKVPTKTQIFERIIDTVEARIKATHKLDRELRKLYEGYFARVQSLILADKELSKSDAMSLQSATKVIDQLGSTLRASGFDDVVATYGDQFETLATVAARYFEPFGLEPSLAGVSRESLTAGINITAKNLGKTIENDLIPVIQSGLLQANYGSLDRQSVIDQVLSIGENLTPNKATVLVDDAFAQYQRAIVTQRAESLDMQIFQYLGPDDGITSPQCQAMLRVNKRGVPGMLYKDEINQSLHPNLTRDPFIGGGHFRCRHSWSPVSEAYAVEKGFVLRG